MVHFACMPSPIPRQVGWIFFVRSYDSIRFGLPRNHGGSAPASLFSGPAQRLLTLRPARSPSRLATLCTRGFSSFVASTAALIATGWSEPVPGRVYPAVDHRLFTAHPVIRLERSRWRGRRCACYVLHAVLYRNFLYREFHFRLFLTTTAKS